MVEYIWDFPWSREVFHEYSEEIQNDGLEGNDETYGIKLEDTF